MVFAKKKQFILWFDQIGIDDVSIVGGKNASLGEMYQNLTARGINVPNGFAITAYAYRYFIEKAGIEDTIKEILSDLDTHDIDNLMTKGQKIRSTILKAELPKELNEVILKAYKDLSDAYKTEDVDVAVRSSATAEDLPDASFAGQQETYLNIEGEYMLLDACKRCFASLFTNRSISYRVDKNFDHFSVYLSIGVQKMVRSDMASSGVMFSIDTESGFKDVVLINGAYGLGENVVQGAVNPDEFYVAKATLGLGKRPIVSKKIGTKRIKMVYSKDSNIPTKNIPVSEKDRHKFVISDDEVLTLAKWAVEIEDYYSQKAGHFKPMDMEWAKDGQTNQLFVVQARPETVQSQRNRLILEDYELKLEKEAVILTSGRSVGDKIGQGRANIIKDVQDIKNFKKGEVLVTEMTDPDWEPIMKIASAIVTERGGRTCHAAIVSRELGIPCIVGTENATRAVKNKTYVTASCSQGETGFVYEGKIPFEIQKINLENVPSTKTKIMMNIGIPSRSFEQSFIPNDGVGLAREEFIINSHIKIHPLALLNYENLLSTKIIHQIDRLTVGYDDKAEFFVDKLSQGVAMIAAAFYPKDVIVRLSDFKSNEYANLVGGELFEPKESNPMIGWRGSSRYYSKKYRDAFALECMALKRVRGTMGFTNVKIMVPFCRTVEEGKKVIAEMKKNGLERGKNGLEVYVMCEIPSNVILADQFSEIFDGFSIGSNDLTQLTLGLDRDSELVSSIYDERNEAVKRLISQVISTAKKHKRKIGICGQAPSDFPEFAEFLVECGIDSISLNPDSLVKTRLRIAKKEAALKKEKGKKTKVKK
ncbi:MAG: phosphoenolpyruvate synthase [Candidatus Diapherotrites archaeon]|nr:phosphoenolpyruvate synthase [Candidatus Diapherotrites archaeon]